MNVVGCNARGEVIFIKGRACIVESCPECGGVLRFDEHEEVVCDSCNTVFEGY